MACALAVLCVKVLLWSVVTPRSVEGCRPTAAASRDGAAAARRAHNPKVGGSNPSPATKRSNRRSQSAPPVLLWGESEVLRPQMPPVDVASSPGTAHRAEPFTLERGDEAHEPIRGQGGLRRDGVPGDGFAVQVAEDADRCASSDARAHGRFLCCGRSRGRPCTSRPSGHRGPRRAVQSRASGRM